MVIQSAPDHFYYTLVFAGFALAITGRVLSLLVLWADHPPRSRGGLISTPRRAAALGLVTSLIVVVWLLVVYGINTVLDGLGDLFAVAPIIAMIAMVIVAIHVVMVPAFLGALVWLSIRHRKEIDREDA